MDNEELDQIAVEFDEHLKLCQDQVARFDKVSNKDKEKKFQEMEKTLQSAHSAMKAFEMEIFGVSANQRAALKQSLQGMQQRYERVRADVEAKRPVDKTTELMSGAKNIAVVSNVESMSGVDILRRGAEIQRQDIDILRRAGDLLEFETTKVAEDTLASLEDQGRILEEVQVDLESMDDSLTRSKKQLQKLGRRLAGDKIMWILIAVVLIAIIFIVVWVVTHPNTAGINTIFGNRTIT